MMSRTLAVLLLLAAASAPAAEPVNVVLEDFSYPAWGVRWSTLEFSKHVSPRLATSANGPDGTPSGMVLLPAGGRIVLITQQETAVWDGIRGKNHWPLPGTPKKLHLSVKAIGEGDVSVRFIVRDKGKKEFRTKWVTAKPGDWRAISLDVPALAAPAQLVGIELKRGGQAGVDAQPVLMDDLRVTTDEPGATLFAALGRCEFDESLVAGKPVECFIRLQSTDARVRQVKVSAMIVHRGRKEKVRRWVYKNGQWQAKPGSAKTQSHAIAVEPGRPGVKKLVFIPTEPGIHDVHFAFDDGQAGKVHEIINGYPARGRMTKKRDIELVVYRDKALASLEGAEANRERLADAQAASKDFTAYLTNLSPALMTRSSSREYRLFDGIASQGLELPAWVAVPEKGGVKIHPTTEAVALSGMAEPWLIFFAGGAKGWDKVRIVSRGKRIPAPMDLPWLVVLQRKPDRLMRQETALVLEFNRAADHVALIPLRGQRTFDPAETARWARSGLPKDLAEHASAWSRRLRRFPLYVKEDFRVDPVADTVTIRQEFDFLDTADDWGTKPETFAPVAPIVALAARAKFPVTFHSSDGKALEVTDGGVVTGVGPASGIVGVESYVYRTRGVLKYINEDRLPLTKGGGETADKLRAMLRDNVGQGERDTPASRWTPGVCIREDYGVAMVGNSERQGLLGSTIPYVTGAEAKWRKDTLLVDALFLVNPNNFGPLVDSRTGRVYSMEGRGWLRFGFGWVDNNAYVGDCVRALDYYAKYAGDVELIRRHWPFIRACFAVVSDFKRHGEWELSCFDTGGGDTWDSIYNAVVGFARLAWRVGDYESYRYACYYFAKHLATLPGHREMNKYVAAQPYWASMLAEVRFAPDGTIAEYHLNIGLKWDGLKATVRDLVFSDVWGANDGLRPWNQTIWMRGSRSEYRAAAELTPEYAKYWLVDRVRKFAPEWHERAIVNHRPPGDAKDRRTGQAVRPAPGDYAGKINVQARAICLGEKLDVLWEHYGMKAQGVSVGSDGRVPRICTPAALLEDGTHQPWVKLFGKAIAAGSDKWERGRDAYMDLGNGKNYMYGMGVGEDGVRFNWRVWVAPGAKQGLSFGAFGPEGLADVKRHNVNWNTSVFTARAAR